MTGKWALNVGEGDLLRAAEDLVKLCREANGYMHDASLHIECAEDALELVRDRIAAFSDALDDLGVSRTLETDGVSAKYTAVQLDSVRVAVYPEEDAVRPLRPGDRVVMNGARLDGSRRTVPRGVQPVRPAGRVPRRVQRGRAGSAGRGYTGVCGD